MRTTDKPRFGTPEGRRAAAERRARVRLGQEEGSCRFCGGEHAMYFWPPCGWADEPDEPAAPRLDPRSDLEDYLFSLNLSRSCDEDGWE